MTESEYLRLQDKAKKAPRGEKLKKQFELRQALHKQLKAEVRAKKRKAA